MKGTGFYLLMSILKLLYFVTKKYFWRLKLIVIFSRVGSESFEFIILYLLTYWCLWKLIDKSKWTFLTNLSTLMHLESRLFHQYFLAYNNAIRIERDSESRIVWSCIRYQTNMQHVSHILIYNIYANRNFGRHKV